MQTPNFRITVVLDSDTVEICGALKVSGFKPKCFYSGQILPSPESSVSHRIYYEFCHHMMSDHRQDVRVPISQSIKKGKRT